MNVEVTEESAPEFLTILERQRRALIDRVSALSKQIKALKQSFGLGPEYTRSSIIGPPNPQPIVRIEKTPHGRIKKGQSEKLVSDFLKNRNGSGATIKEITAESGTKYGTTRRILNHLKDEDRVQEKSGLWTWAA